MAESMDTTMTALKIRVRVSTGASVIEKSAHVATPACSDKDGTIVYNGVSASTDSWAKVKRANQEIQQFRILGKDNSPDVIKRLVLRGTMVVTTQVTNMEYMFCEVSLPTQIGVISSWDTRNVTSMEGMFDSSNFNQDISKWNTSNVTSMKFMFVYSNFNNGDGENPLQSVESGINTGFGSSFGQNCTLEGMFQTAFNFNQDISKWNTANVIDMSHMFDYNLSFNQDISKWNTSNVTSMKFMFVYSNFNNGDQSLQSVESGINTGFGSSFGQNCTLKGMFQNTYAFNQDISKWNTSNVTNMSYMFRESFFKRSQDLFEWNGKLTNVRDWDSMLSNSMLYDLLISTGTTPSGQDYPKIIRHYLSVND